MQSKYNDRKDDIDTLTFVTSIKFDSCLKWIMSMSLAESEIHFLREGRFQMRLSSEWVYVNYTVSSILSPCRRIRKLDE